MDGNELAKKLLALNAVAHRRPELKDSMVAAAYAMISTANAASVSAEFKKRQVKQ